MKNYIALQEVIDRADDISDDFIASLKEKYGGQDGPNGTEFPICCDCCEADMYATVEQIALCYDIYCDECQHTNGLGYHE